MFIISKMMSFISNWTTFLFKNYVQRLYICLIVTKMDSITYNNFVLGFLIRHVLIRYGYLLSWFYNKKIRITKRPYWCRGYQRGPRGTRSTLTAAVSYFPELEPEVFGSGCNGDVPEDEMRRVWDVARAASESLAESIPGTIARFSPDKGGNRQLV